MIEVQRRQDGIAIVAPTLRAGWLYAAGIILLGALVRLVGAGTRPLQPGESDAAFAAYSLYRGTLEGYVAAPLALNLQALSFWLFGSGDVQARLPGILAGCGLIAVPLFLTNLSLDRRVGAAAIVAVSSTSIFAAREGAEASVSTLLAAGLAVALWNQSHAPSRRWILIAACTLGLGIASGPAFVASALVMLIVALVDWLPRARRWKLEASARHQARLVAILIALSFTLGATGLGTNLPGFQAGLASLWRWVSILLPSGFGRLPGWALDDPLLPLLALIGAAVVLRGGLPGERLLVVWAASQGALLILTGATDLRFIALAVPPFALLGGATLGAAKRRMSGASLGDFAWIAMLAIVPVIFFIFSALNLATMARALRPEVVLFAVAALGLVILFAVSTRPRREWIPTAVLALGLLLMLAQFRGIATLNLGEPRAGQSLLRPTATLVSIREVSRVTELWERAEPRGTIVVDESLKASLAWELRERQTVRYEPVGALIRDNAVVASNAPRGALEGREIISIPIQESMPDSARPFSPGTSLRWYLSRESLERPESHAILLVH